MKINNISSIPAVQLCCGCGACAYLFPSDIQMVDFPSLGRRPTLSGMLEDEETRKALQVCPGVELSHTVIGTKLEMVIASLLQSWGPILEVWEVYAADEELRFKGSSGGAITATSLFCLEQTKMAGVLHTVVDPKKSYQNTTVFSRDRSSLIKGAGSRYSPSSPCEKLAEVENAKGKCVIVGKPCDIAAVQKVRRIRSALDNSIGITIACFCAGTPSTNGTLEMLRQMGVNNVDRLCSLSYRGNGWPGMTTVEMIGEEEGEGCHDMTYEQSWGGILQKYRQWRCYICPDHTGEFADLAVGDPWYKEIEKGDTGRSLVLVRTEKGRNILHSAIAMGYLVAEIKDPGVLPASQKNLERTRARLWGQLLALKLLGVPCPKYTGFHLFQNWSSKLTIVEKMRSIVGTMKRVYVKQLKKQQDIF